MKRWLCTITWLWLAALPALAQERLIVGTYDPAHANALIFGAAQRDDKGTQWQSFFGVRLLVYRQGETVEDAPPLARIALFGPQASNGAYGRLHWELPFTSKLATLQWAHTGPRTVVARFAAQTRLRIALEAYQPFPAFPETNRLNFRAPDIRTLTGEPVGKPKGKPLRLLVRADRAGDGAASYNDAAALRATLVKEGRALPLQAEPNAAFGVHRYGALSFELNEKDALGFVIVLGEDAALLDGEADRALREPAAKTLEQAETRYETARPRSEGWLADALEALSRAVNWNRLVLPELRGEFASAWRAATPQAKQINVHWDAFLRAMTSALIDPPQAETSIRGLLERQGSDGRLTPALLSVNAQPNGETTVLAGRAIPPVATLAAWKTSPWY